MLLALAACAPRLEEKRRAESQFHTFEAVVAERQTDATVSTPVEIYIVKTGAPLQGQPVFKASRVYGLSLDWTGDERLKIHVASGNAIIAETEARVGGRDVIIDYD